MTPSKNPLKKVAPRPAAPAPTEEQRRQWLELKAEADAKRAQPAPDPEPVVVPDDYDPRGKEDKPTQPQGRFWFALHDGTGWFDEHGQKWPPPIPEEEPFKPIPWIQDEPETDLFGYDEDPPGTFNARKNPPVKKRGRRVNR